MYNETKKVVSKRFHAIMYNQNIYKSFITKLFDTKKRLKQIDNGSHNTLLRKHVNVFIMKLVDKKRLKQIINESQNALLRICFIGFRSSICYLRNWSHIICKTYLNRPPPPIAVIRKRKQADNIKTLLILLRHLISIGCWSTVPLLITLNRWILNYERVYNMLLII